MRTRLQNVQHVLIKILSNSAEKNANAFYRDISYGMSCPLIYILRALFKRLTFHSSGIPPFLCF